MCNEITDEIAKSAIRLAGTSVQRKVKSLKTIYREISEIAGCALKVRGKALTTRKTTKM